MKKAISIILSIIFVMLFTCSPVPAIASNSMYSLYADEEIAAQIRKEERDIVIKLYGLSFMHAFAESTKIEDMIGEYTQYMVIPSDDQAPSYYNYYNGQLCIINSAYGVDDWSGFYQYAVYPELVFDAWVKIYDVYCLNGDASHDGVYIYYKTSKGDYVLFKEYLEAEEEYFFPVKDFYEFAAKVYAERLQHQYSDGGALPIAERYELTTYKFEAKTRRTSEMLQWMLPITFVIIVAGVGAAWIFIRKKRKV